MYIYIWQLGYREITIAYDPWFAITLGDLLRIADQLDNDGA